MRVVRHPSQTRDAHKHTHVSYKYTHTHTLSLSLSRSLSLSHTHKRMHLFPPSLPLLLPLSLSLSPSLSSDPPIPSTVEREREAVMNDCMAYEDTMSARMRKSQELAQAEASEEKCDVPRAPHDVAGITTRRTSTRSKPSVHGARCSHPIAPCQQVTSSPSDS